ncbi:hypothetical protein MRX96_005423 [Rhipicephalus microplus]
MVTKVCEPPPSRDVVVNMRPALGVGYWATLLVCATLLFISPGHDPFDPQSNIMQINVHRPFVSSPEPRNTENHELSGAAAGPYLLTGDADTLRGPSSRIETSARLDEESGAGF